ncbi:hypothetical protein BGZ63DRAFT_416374 [Mariannaea sp. PMI_226]|nr:hypothetical protein BGZ63DRAFT_416374 [Mariannaea sp. PMI_226]
MSADRTLVVIGAGPGIGRSVASTFSSNRFSKIALVARREESLQAEKSSLEKTSTRAVTVKTYVVDVSDGDALVSAMDKIEADLGQPEVIFYNAARVLPSMLFEHPVADIELDFKITVTSMYKLAGREIPRLVDLAKSDPTSEPGFLVTSSLLPSDPIPELFALSLTKGAQWNLANSLHKRFKKDRVCIGAMIVGGPVSPEEPSRNPDNIAKKTWEWYASSHETRPFEVEIL